MRDNGGGNLTVVDKLVSQFIDQTITAGYICHKTGPGHDDFSRPFAYTIEPATGHVRWLKPVVVLTNRSTFSAANNFVSIMKSRKNTAIVGDITGGGSGMPFSSELPCGWGIRFSPSRLRRRYESHRKRRGAFPELPHRHEPRRRSPWQRFHRRLRHSPDKSIGKTGIITTGPTRK